MVRIIALLALVAGVKGEDRVDECKFRARLFFFPSSPPGSLPLLFTQFPLHATR